MTIHCNFHPRFDHSSKVWPLRVLIFIATILYSLTVCETIFMTNCLLKKVPFLQQLYMFYVIRTCNSKVLPYVPRLSRMTCNVFFFIGKCHCYKKTYIIFIIDQLKRFAGDRWPTKGTETHQFTQSVMTASATIQWPINTLSLTAVIERTATLNTVRTCFKLKQTHDTWNLSFFSTDITGMYSQVNRDYNIGWLCLFFSFLKFYWIFIGLFFFNEMFPAL